MKTLGAPGKETIKLAKRRSHPVGVAKSIEPGAVSPANVAPTLVPRAWLRKTGPAATMIESFYHAFHGIWIGLKEERNVRIHFVLVALVVTLGLWLKVDAQSWIALTVAMAMVVTAEFVNTSLEHLVDISANKEFHESARYAKDTAAAAVLVASIAAAIIGSIIFVPRLLQLIQH